jgi:hypothetical protein
MRPSLFSLPKKQCLLGWPRLCFTQSCSEKRDLKKLERQPRMNTNVRQSELDILNFNRLADF